MKYIEIIILSIIALILAAILWRQTQIVGFLYQEDLASQYEEEVINQIKK